jgi:hypothetical protein
MMHQRLTDVRTRRRIATGIVLCLVMATTTFGAPAPQDGGAAPSGVCIAVMLPSIKGFPGDADNVGNAMRELFANYLTAPTFKTIMLDARLAVLAMNEAKEKGCANVLTFSVTGKQAGPSRLGQIAGQAAGNAAVYMPGAGSLGAAAARGAAVGTALSLSNIAATTKVRDEVKLEFRVQTPGNAVRVGPGSHEAKAQVNGEDILTPVVEAAATQIVNGISKLQ